MKVKMYSTEWCTACKQARKWLEEKGVEVEELDIIELPGEWQSVPVFYIGGEMCIRDRAKLIGHMGVILGCVITTQNCLRNCRKDVRK